MAETNKTFPEPSPCAQCGGPHDFDTSVPSVVWNAVIRTSNLPDYLCMTCIVREFVRMRQSFTAQLWNEEFNGINIEIVVEGQTANDAALVQEENNSLRNQLSMMDERALITAKEVCVPSLSDAIKEVERLYDEWWDIDRRTCLNMVLGRLKALSP